MYTYVHVCIMYIYMYVYGRHQDASNTSRCRYILHGTSCVFVSNSIPLTSFTQASGVSSDTMDKSMCELCKSLEAVERSIGDLSFLVKFKKSKDSNIS